MNKLKMAYREIVVDHHKLDGWTAYRKGRTNSWDFYHEGMYVGNVTVLPSGMMSIKTR